MWRRAYTDTASRRPLKAPAAPKRPLHHNQLPPPPPPTRGRAYSEPAQSCASPREPPATRPSERCARTSLARPSACAAQLEWRRAPSHTHTHTHISQSSPGDSPATSLEMRKPRHEPRALCMGAESRALCLALCMGAHHTRISLARVCVALSPNEASRATSSSSKSSSLIGQLTWIRIGVGFQPRLRLSRSRRHSLGSSAGLGLGLGFSLGLG